MRNVLTLSPADAVHRTRLTEALADELYRRSVLAVLIWLPSIYVLYLVLAGAIERRPALGWAFAAVLLLSMPRLIAVLGASRLRVRMPDPARRVHLYAFTAGLLGAGLAAINVIAAPVVTAEEVAILAMVMTGFTSVALISMSASFLSYMMFTVPSLGSIAMVVLLGPSSPYSAMILLLLVLQLLALTLMVLLMHLALRKSILLRLRVGDANRELNDANGKLQSEIDDRITAETSLQQRNAQLEAVNRELAGTQNQLLQSEKMASVGQLAAGVAHEINNPIGYVGSNLASLKRYVDDLFALVRAYEKLEQSVPAGDAQLRLVQDIKASIELDYLRGDTSNLVAEAQEGITRVQKIVSELKDFSHLGEPEWQLADLHRGLDSTLNLVMNQIKYKAELVKEYGELPPIECLPFQLNQVFLNLLVNASQAIEQRGRITIRTGRDADMVWVQIADTGKGIDEAHLNRIFEPFFTTKPIGVGTGLGLSVSYGIVQNHGGRIEVDSEVGRGTTFTVHLPIRAHRKDDTANAATPIASARAPAQGHPVDEISPRRAASR
jgi:signal transduction histidine kinase